MTKLPPLSRRQLIKGSAFAAAATAFRPFFPGRVLGANDRINLAIVGIRSRGGSHINSFGKMPGVQIKTLVDVDENLFARAVKGIESRSQYTADTATDMRKVFEDKNIDAVTFAIVCVNRPGGR